MFLPLLLVKLGPESRPTAAPTKFASAGAVYLIGYFCSRGYIAT